MSQTDEKVVEWGLMDKFEEDEFWKGLGRLYDATTNLATATENLRQIAEAHEKRLDKLAEKEREREK